MICIMIFMKTSPAMFHTTIESKFVMYLYYSNDTIITEINNVEQ